jgi:hypothetical protein
MSRLAGCWGFYRPIGLDQLSWPVRIFSAFQEFAIFAKMPLRYFTPLMAA